MIPSPSHIINMEEGVSEISSSTSKEGNKEAFHRKIHSRKYKFLLHVIISTLAVLLIVWLTMLAKGLQYVVTKLDLDLHKVIGQLNNSAMFSALGQKDEID